ncbi:ABC transporter ATP-binding protein [Bacillus chungangensis]|uniref:ABC-2 type transport system ATP-binding protein n=1 Tax=Bacillus chungangensis TaxID=587633 RepID=A0ABT9WT83_9BACI|nr:ABC transporter ATP-binding protein [Bacillus chungangensis]MDQ0176401.1 ABC-2 type transport system ATP-binding protein [Bacillus chungangensis]
MLKVQNVTKKYDKKKVIQDISFHVRKGEAFGLLGPNGAGKSTLIGMLCGLLPYDQGDVEVGGVSVRKNLLMIKKKIGVVPQDIALYPTMSAHDNLIFWGRMYGLKKIEAKKRAAEVLKMVGLSERAKERIETYSGGMKRRINIGAALMHEPELLIMDEPTVGIDPQSRNHILETVKKLNQAGMTIIYTSHYMEEVEYLCEKIAIIDNGELIVIGTKMEILNRLAGGTVLKLKVENATDQYIEALKTIPGVEKLVLIEEGDLDLMITDRQQVLGKVVSLSVAQEIPILSIHIQEPNLETLFLQLTGRSLRD